MEIAELRSFLVLAYELHFRKAAEELFLSQPALSKQIRRLEDKAGGALFARTRRKVVLTEIGKVLRPLAAKLISDAHSAMNLTREAADGRAGALSIGFGIAAVSEILPRTILRFQKADPHIELRMRDMSTPSQVDLRRAGSASKSKIGSTHGPTLRGSLPVEVSELLLRRLRGAW